MCDAVMAGMDELVRTLQSGATNLGAYLAGHVLLCLLPAFFIAGALSTLVPKEAITRRLGPDAPRWLLLDVQAVRKTRLLSLAELRAEAALADLVLLRRGNRLSITPVEAAHWAHVMAMLGGAH